MDVELQVLKHLARDAHSTAPVIDEYCAENQQKISQVEKKDNSVDFSVHQQWDCGSGWKNTLNNLRLILQPTLVLWLIFPWLEVFPNSKLLLGFNHLISLINQYQPFYSSG